MVALACLRRVCEHDAGARFGRLSPPFQRADGCESAFWTAVWAALALAFNGLVWHWGGSTAAVQFLTGYLVEWSLSMDNVFVFAVIFTFSRCRSSTSIECCFGAF